MKTPLSLKIFLPLLVFLSSCTRNVHYPEGVLSPANKSVASVSIPKINPSRTSHTLNRQGAVFFTPSTIAKTFLEKECVLGKRVVDVGTGFSDIPIRALENGVSEYIANDLSEDHLKILVKKVIDAGAESKLSNLKLLCGKAPKTLKKLHGKYNAILADKVIHFFTPTEVEEFIEWAKSALVASGRIYVTAGSIYSILGLNDTYQAQYLQNLKDGKEFPGYFSDVMSKLKESGNTPKNYIVPEQMILFSKTDMENLFKKHGMRIVESFSFRQPKEGASEWEVFSNENYDNPGTIVGVIAELN